MTAVRARSLAHRGRVPACGFLFDLRLLSEAEARRRILALWVPGAAVYRIEDGLVLRLPLPQWTDCRRAPGAPLEARPKTAPSTNR